MTLRPTLLRQIHRFCTASTLQSGARLAQRLCGAAAGAHPEAAVTHLLKPLLDETIAEMESGAVSMVGGLGEGCCPRGCPWFPRGSEGAGVHVGLIGMVPPWVWVRGVAGGS